MPANDSSPFLIVGLGNPGSEYEQTRHNLGFDLVDSVAQRWRAADFRKKFHGLLTEGQFEGKKVLLLKPQTFMNRSGLSVGEAVTFYKIDPASRVLLVSDDLDLPPGQLRLRLFGGAGGHNGLKSVIECLGTETFYRLRIGVGRPTRDGIDYLLSKIGKAENDLFQKAIAVAAEATESILRDGMHKAMDTYNRKEKL